MHSFKFAIHVSMSKIRLYLKLKMDVGHPKHVLQT